MIYYLPIPVFHLLLTTSSDSILISGVLLRTPYWFVFLRRCGGATHDRTPILGCTQEPREKLPIP